MECRYPQRLLREQLIDADREAPASFSIQKHGQLRRVRMKSWIATEPSCGIGVALRDEIRPDDVQALKPPGWGWRVNQRERHSVDVACSGRALPGSVSKSLARFQFVTSRIANLEAAGCGRQA